MEQLTRVAAYCRVSTDSDDQLHSLESQRSYFLSYISSHSDWVLAEIYADEGISGTSTRRRAAFNHMISDAQAGKIDLILTKEVSRFARNTVDTLEFTRKLRSIGVGVLFLEDGIDTRAGDGEFRLAIMASVAQEESRKTSERVRWGQRRSMEQGVVFGNDSTYGFITREGRLSIREDEADIVRSIYRSYAKGDRGAASIARELNGRGVPSPKGVLWSPAMVLRILKNEKYAGDLRQQKYVTVDHLTHRKIRNPQPEETILFRDHHPAIVRRELWERAQMVLSHRSGRKGIPAHSSWCAGRIRCAACGATFLLRRSRRADGMEYRAWECRSRAERGAGACEMRMVNQRQLDAALRFAVSLLGIEREVICAELAKQLRGCAPSACADRAELMERRDRLLDAYLRGVVSEADLLRLRARYDRALEEPQPEKRDDLLEVLLEAADEELIFSALVESITVDSEELLVQIRHLPVELCVRYTSGGLGKSYHVEVTGWMARPTGIRKD